MYIKDGYRHEMTAEDIRKTCNSEVLNNIFKNAKGRTGVYAGVFVATTYGPVASHEIELFKTPEEALEWMLKSIGNTIVDEVCPLCYADTYDTGTEWEIVFKELPR